MQAEPIYPDPVVAEIHEVRRRLLEESGGDVAEFRRRLRERENASGRKIIKGPLIKQPKSRNVIDSPASS
jgi:hypothetical protein